MRSLWDVPSVRAKVSWGVFCSNNPITGHEWESYGTTKPTTIMGPIDPVTKMGNMQNVDVEHVVVVLCQNCGKTPQEVLTEHPNG